MRRFGIEDAMPAEAVELGTTEVTVQETARYAPCRNWPAGYGLRQVGVPATISALDPSPDWPGHSVRETRTIGP